MHHSLTEQEFVSLVQGRLLILGNGDTMELPFGWTRAMQLVGIARLELKKETELLTKEIERDNETD